MIRWLKGRQFIQWLHAKETPKTPEHLDRSYLFMRKCVGYIGIALPIVLLVGTMILGNNFRIWDTISGYYYHETRNIFVGSLCAIAIFLISYRYEHLDDIVSTVAGASAIGVALFPTAPDPPLDPTAQQRMIGMVHLSFAGFFLGTLALMAILLFRKSDKKNPKDRTSEKRLRNWVYLGCGIAILLLIVAIAVVQFLSGNRPNPLHPVFWLESLAVWAFAISWFVKGETLGILKDKDKKEAIPAPGGIQNIATRVVASILGILAGVIGLEHGRLETLQGNARSSVIFIHAMGPHCQWNRVWHLCYSAMTIIPNFFVTGLLAFNVSLIVLIWAAAFVQGKHGGKVLILLSIIQLLVGGGFISPVLCFIAGVVGTRIQAPFTSLRAHLSVHPLRQHWLAIGWLGSLILIVVLLAGYATLGPFFNEFVLSLALNPLFFILEFLLLAVLTVLAILTGFAYDTQRQINPLSEAKSLIYQAILYWKKGKYEEAEPLYERALAIYEHVPGEEPPDTASTLNNLANLYTDQGKYEVAEPLYQRAQVIRERVLGAEHPDTKRVRENDNELHQK